MALPMSFLGGCPLAVVGQAELEEGVRDWGWTRPMVAWMLPLSCQAGTRVLDEV